MIYDYKASEENIEPINKTLNCDWDTPMRKLYIEPTSRCNFHCSMCFRNTWFDEKFADMPFDTLKKAIDTMPDTVETIFFGGMGEPLLHPEILSMIEYAAPRVREIHVLTNGSLLAKDMAQALIDAGITMLWVSLDEFHSGEKDETGHHHDFDDLVDKMVEFRRLSAIVNYKQGRVKSSDVKGLRILKDSDLFTDEETETDRNKPKIKLGIAFVAMKGNIRELKYLPQLACTLEIDEVNITNSYVSDGESAKDILYERTVDVEVGSSSMAAIKPKISLPYMDWGLDESWDVFRTLVTSVDVDLYVSDIPLRRKTHYCRFIEEGMCFVRYDGNVSPCIALLHNSFTFWGDEKRTVYHYSYGNVEQASLNGIWENQEYRAFRKRVHEFTFSPCIRCGRCNLFSENREDCYGNVGPTCGGCLWSEGIISCP